jgi:glutamyl-tRNA synthetase
MFPSAPRVRFAPSPTGYLHTGGARTALFNWLYARRNSGTFVLRIEDTDAARNTPRALAAIFDGLRWLGLDWNEGPERGGEYGPYFQSQRQHIYDAYLARLTESGLTYTEENGAVRFKSDQEYILLPDEISGDIKIDRTSEPDMTIRRPDGSYIFHFVNVVDDIEMKITHVIRGEDHIYNTGKHVQLFRAFGEEPPVYAHIPLILNQDGSKMSKRDQGAAVGYYMENGFVPEAVRNYLCLLGWSPKDDREVLPIGEVVKLFDWEHCNHHNAKFDMEKCRWMNGEYVKAQSTEDFAAACQAWLTMVPQNREDMADVRNTGRFTAFKPCLEGAPLDGLLALIKPKVRVAAECFEHLAMLLDPAAPLAGDARAKLSAQADITARLHALTAHLEALVHWNREHIEIGVQLAAAELSVKPGALMFPLRVALTGQGHGVDLLPALELLGKAETVARLRARTPLLTPA